MKNNFGGGYTLYWRPEKWFCNFFLLPTQKIMSPTQKIMSPTQKNMLTTTSKHEKKWKKSEKKWKKWWSGPPSKKSWNGTCSCFVFDPGSSGKRWKKVLNFVTFFFSKKVIFFIFFQLFVFPTWKLMKVVSRVATREDNFHHLFMSRNAKVDDDKSSYTSRAMC